MHTPSPGKTAAKFVGPIKPTRGEDRMTDKRGRGEKAPICFYRSFVPLSLRPLSPFRASVVSLATVR